MIYLGQPYSHPDPTRMKWRYKVAMSVCADLSLQGRLVYSPIVSWHEVARAHDLPKGEKYWRAQNLHFIDLADGFYILRIGGWKTSTGLAYEISFARDKRPGHMPVYFVCYVERKVLVTQATSYHEIEELITNGEDSKQQEPYTGSPGGSASG